MKKQLVKKQKENRRNYINSFSNNNYCAFNTCRSGNCDINR